MVVATSHADGVSLERAQTRGRLSGVGDARLVAGGNRVDERARLARDAAHALDEVEGDPLAHQDRTRTAPHRPEAPPREGPRAVGRADLHRERRVDPGEHAREDGPPADHHRRSRHGMRHRLGGRVDARLSRQIA